MLWPEGLSRTSDLPEILWYFSHYPDNRRLVLSQDPNFYDPFPHPSGEYVGIQPIDINQRMNNVLAGNGPVFDVLTNNRPRVSNTMIYRPRVFLDRNPHPRIFDNIWIINGIFIFRSSYVLFLFSPRLTSFQMLPEVSRIVKPSLAFFPLSDLAGIQTLNLNQLGI